MKALKAWFLTRRRHDSCALEGGGRVERDEASDPAGPTLPAKLTVPVDTRDRAESCRARPAVWRRLDARLTCGRGSGAEAEAPPSPAAGGAAGPCSSAPAAGPSSPCGPTCTLPSIHSGTDA